MRDDQFTDPPLNCGVVLRDAPARTYPRVLDFGGRVGTGVVFPYEPALALGTKDFTVEAWLRFPEAVAAVEGYMLLSFGWLAQNRCGLDLYVCSAYHPRHGPGVETHFGGFRTDCVYDAQAKEEGRERYRRLCDGGFLS